MSQRYKGGVISATPPTTSTSSASGVWTEQQFMQGVASGNWPALAGAPTIGTATAGALSASVAFTAPTYTGSGITGYTATSSPGGITGTGASSPVTVSGLTAGTAYTFTVTATTAAGQGSASAASNSVTPTLPQYIEDAFSTYLYTGNSSAQTITNGIDLAGKGGMVWLKSRTSASVNNLWDTVRAPYYYLVSNDTVAQQSVGSSNALTAYNSNGFTVTGGSNAWNGSANTYVSWTFAEQAKFFDVLTYTGNGTAGRTIAHNLGSVPGCIIVKAYSVDTGDYWGVYHRSLGATKAIFLSATNAAATSSTYWNDTEPTSTNFTVGDWSGVNQNGTSYVAYLFAHDAGGFGLTGTDNVISCGTFTTDGSGLFSVTLGYEPQWVMVKRSSGVGDWIMFDTMRGMPTAAASGVFSATLFANTTAAEDAAGGTVGVNATGFNSLNGYLASSSTFIYIAIRRGPMQTPTVGTSVFTPQTWTGTGTNSRVFTGSGFPLDVLMIGSRDAVQFASYWFTDRLQGASPHLQTASTSAAFNTTSYFVSKLDSMDGYVGGTLDYDQANNSGSTRVQYFFRRAPGFLDEVCYTGTGSANRQISHNLGVAPELVICKARNNGSQEWRVLSTALSQVGKLNGAGAFSTTNLAIYFGNDSTYVAPTSSVFTVGSAGDTNANTVTYVAYLFATCAGVSKVGSYTGNGSTQTIDCGFTGGARFVLIKRTDSTGDWYVYDTARGMTVLTDPYLLLNSTAAETATLGSVTTVSTGFALNSAVLADINVSAGTYIFLAIA